MSSELELSQQEARELTNRINECVKSIVDAGEKYTELVMSAWTGRVWKSLGYESWDEYCKAEIPLISRSVEDRRPLVLALREKDMSTSAIAAVTNQSDMNVRRDLAAATNVAPEGGRKVIGLDGKTYTTKPRPAPEPPIVDAELEPEEPELPQATALSQHDLIVHSTQTLIHTTSISPSLRRTTLLIRLIRSRILNTQTGAILLS